MNKEEVLNDDFVEKEVVQPKSQKKFKIAIAITASLAIIATTILLVGYFKFDWFKSGTYTLDAKISRNTYQANYFTETRTINTKIGFTSGVSENHEQKIYTNFMVLQTDRKELENNDFLNTATLVILDAKVEYGNELKEITSFNIFNQDKLDEVKNNPNGAKYPMAVFTFYENGTVADILLPNNMDNYNANSIIELIGNVIPQLSRNRKEDISNGIKITTKKDKNKRTIVESIAPEQLEDFRDSRFVKSVERDIENEQLTSVRSKASLDLETKLKEGESSFGLQEFKYETKSNIIATGSKEEKENVELLKKLAEYYTFIDGRDLLNSLEKEEKVVDRWEIKEAKIDSKLRNLLDFTDLNVDKTFDIKTFTICGCKFSIKARLGISDFKAFGEIIIEANHGSVKFGTDGISASYSKTWSGELTVFSFKFPPLPIISLDLKAGGSITVSASLDNEKITVGISGSLYGKVEIKAGWDYAVSLSAGVKGTLVSASLNGAIDFNGELEKSGKLSAGTIVIYVEGKALTFKIFHHDWTMWNGWSTSF